MFVRIIRGDHESLYECMRMYIHPLNVDGDKLPQGAVPSASSKFDIVMESPGEGSVTAQIDREEKVEVFIMNNAGQTIDSRRYGS